MRMESLLLRNGRIFSTQQEYRLQGNKWFRYFLDSLFLEKYSREEVDHFFDTKDRDFDGRLSFAEIMGEETPIERLFNMMDKNGDGFVSKKVSL